MENNNKKLFPLVLIFVGCLGIGGGVYWYVADRSAKEVSDAGDTRTVSTDYDVTQELTTESGERVGTAHVSVSGDIEIKAKADCGRDSDCFYNDKFPKCEPATVIVSSAVASSVEYKYEIIGPKEGKCEVVSEFTKIPEGGDTYMVGKQMSCLYDQTKDFQQESIAVVTKISSKDPGSTCTGDLARYLAGER